jgi:hypothetical protein
MTEYRRLLGALSLALARELHALGEGAWDERLADEALAARAALDAYVERLATALDAIARLGMDCPPPFEPAAFYREQLSSAIGTAARALDANG